MISYQTKDIFTKFKKPIAWLTIGLSIYLVRDFFLVIFLTFIVTYIMLSATNRIGSLIFRDKPVPRVAEISTVVFCFLMLIGGFYSVGAYLVPKLVAQGQTLVRKFTANGPHNPGTLNDILTNTVGSYLFKQKFGEPKSKEYMEAFAQFRDPNRVGKEFDNSARKLKVAFENQLSINQSFESLIRGNKVPEDEESAIREWILKNKAPIVLEGSGSEIRLEWEKKYKDFEFDIPGITPLSRLSERRKRDALLHYVTKSILANESILPSLIAEWKKAKIARRINTLKKEEYDKKFRMFYDEYRELNPTTLPYPYETFRLLKDSQDVSPEAFRAAIAKTYPKAEKDETSHDRAIKAFEQHEKRNLVQDWQKGTMAAMLRDKLGEYFFIGMKTLGKYIGETVPKLLELPFRLAMILLLSFLICIDIPRMKKGLNLVANSRAKNLYELLVPDLTKFGRLIGRAFQAQGVIAIVNSVLTLIAIQFLEIQNAAFLCTIVFISSFIPVLGVVLSSVPIAIMALIQDGGGFTLAAYSVLAILVIHFLETSLFNPKILGDMLHLHPVLVIGILFFSGHYFGVWGLLLGVPVMVYFIRIVILGQGIPGLIDTDE